MLRHYVSICVLYSTVSLSQSLMVVETAKEYASNVKKSLCVLNRAV